MSQKASPSPKGPPGVDWGNSDQVRKALKHNGFDLQYASAALKQHDKTVLRAVQTNGTALKHADLTGILRGNRKIALAAVTNDGEALQYVASVSTETGATTSYTCARVTSTRGVRSSPAPSPCTLPRPRAHVRAGPASRQGGGASSAGAGELSVAFVA